MSGSAPTQAQQQFAAQQQNLAIRNSIVQSALPVRLPIYTATMTLASLAGGPISIQQQIRNVGLLRGFLVRVTLNIKANATPTWALTEFGQWNLLSNITFYDLANYMRHNAPGWAFATNQAMRRGRSGVPGKSKTAMPWPYTSSPTLTAGNSGPAFGNNYPQVASAPSTITDTSTHAINQTYYIPVAKSDSDLRGAIYLGVVSATTNLLLTVNPNPVGISTADPYTYIYTDAASANALDPSTSVTIEVYQDWYDQLPTNNGVPILPALDIARNYQIQNAAFPNIVANNDFPILYGNYRWFLSTMVAFDNGGTFNAGSDINYWSLVTANFSQMLKVDPYTQTSMTRELLETDLPKGLYFFDHSDRPINSSQFGNIALNLNASNVNAGAVAYVAWEFITTQGTALGAGTLNGT